MRRSATCPFCNLSADEVIAANATFRARFDRYPVSRGHVLLIPQRHIRSFFQLDEDEIRDFLDLAKKVRKIVIAAFSPDGFNLGVNVGKWAGQTVPHVHIHMIPRYKGDVKSPQGGIRRFIPNLVEYPLDTSELAHGKTSSIVTDLGSREG